MKKFEIFVSLECETLEEVEELMGDFLRACEIRFSKTHETLSEVVKDYGICD